MSPGDLTALTWAWRRLLARPVDRAADGGPSQTEQMASKYDPLGRFLEDQPGEEVVSLTFAEVTALVGALPQSSATTMWWSNTVGHPQALAWLRAGRRLIKLRPGDTVVFSPVSLRCPSPQLHTSRQPGQKPGSPCRHEWSRRTRQRLSKRPATPRSSQLLHPTHSSCTLTPSPRLRAGRSSPSFVTPRGAVPSRRSPTARRRGTVPRQHHAHPVLPLGRPQIPWG